MGPTTLMDDEEYSGMQRNLKLLDGRRAQVAAKVGELKKAIDNRRAARVPLGAELVVGIDATATEDPWPEYNAARKDLAKFEGAVRLQRELMDRCRRQASARICRQILPEYLDVVQAVETAAAHLAHAMQGERQFRGQHSGIDLVHPIETLAADLAVFGAGGSSRLESLLKRCRLILANGRRRLDPSAATTLEPTPNERPAAPRRPTPPAKPDKKAQVEAKEPLIRRIVRAPHMAPQDPAARPA